MNLLPPALCGLMLLSPCAVLAQQSASEPAKSPVASAETSEAPSGSESAAAGQTPATVSEAPSESGDEDSSPFDYKASEQISEDLSVSFPVDI